MGWLRETRPNELTRSPGHGVHTERVVAGRSAGSRREPVPLPDELRSGIERLSGFALDPVRVHYNSTKPSQLGVLAFAQGTAIHVAPGQERHLPHEAWHVVQQAQGRVSPSTAHLRGSSVNTESALEQEAERMGARATRIRPAAFGTVRPRELLALPNGRAVVQRMKQKDERTVISTVDEFEQVPEAAHFEHQDQHGGSRGRTHHR